MMAHNFQSRRVFSTYVEVILMLDEHKKYQWGILHVCGGDPMLVGSLDLCKVYSPRMWR